MITKKDFIFDGHPMLRTVAREVAIPLSAEDQALMGKLLEYLQNSQDKKLAKKYKLKEGVGLAAPQINLNKRIFAVRAEDEQGVLHEYVLANPKLVSHSEEVTYLPDGEGCLSMKKDIAGIVPRFARVRMTGYDLNGELVEIKVRGFIAIVLQHELDHLNGKMFYDHINPINPLMPPAGAVPIATKKD